MRLCRRIFRVWVCGPLFVLLAGTVGLLWFSVEESIPGEGASPESATFSAVAGESGEGAPRAGSGAPGADAGDFAGSGVAAKSLSRWGGPALPEAGGRKIFDGEVLDVMTEPLDVPGHHRRTRLLRTDFHYPLVRVEERIFLDEENQRVEILDQEGVVGSHVLVRRAPSVSPQAFVARAERAGYPVQREMRSEGLYRLSIPAQTVGDLPEALAVLDGWTADLAYAEADAIVFLQEDPVEPDDPAYLAGLLWGLQNTGQNGGTAGKDINAPHGWGVRTDTGNVVIGVVDSGIEFEHEDLLDNMWINPDAGAPQATVHGYDAISGGVQAPLDQNRHGTHVAGTIGAVGDNDRGMAGVAWETRLMALKFVGQSSAGTISDAVDAIDFGIENGATVLNNSWGGSRFSQTLFDAVERAYQADVLFLAAAGNNGSQAILYPAVLPLPNVVAVASYDRNGRRSNFSNFSVSRVHIAAPGDAIHSTSVDPNDSSVKDRYETLSGTSMATPHVSGVIALMRAQFPSESTLQITNRLLAAADTSIMENEVIAGGADLVASLTGEPVGPLNDDFANARDLGRRSITTLGNNTLATVEEGEPAHGGVSANQSVWFAWESPFDREIDVTVSSAEFDAVVAVYTGTEWGDLTQVAAAEADPAGETEAALTFTGSRDQRYFFAVDTVDGREGAFRLTVESTPDNDRFENAQVLTGDGGVFSANNFGATKAMGEGRHGGLFGGASVWYQHTPAIDGRLAVRNGAGSPVDLGISIYSGDTLLDLIELDGVRSSTDQRASAFGFLEAGETYYIAVDTPNGVERDFFLEWSHGSNAIALKESEVAVTDAGGLLEITVERISGLPNPPESSVEWFTTGARTGAVPGEDFAASSGTVTWARNETGGKTITLSILENASLRGDREFFVRLRDPGGGAYFLPGRDRLRVRIEDSVDPFAGLPGVDSLFYFAESVYRGYTVDTQIWLPVRRLGNPGEAETVRLAFAGGTAEAGEDFAGDPVDVEFAPGETVRWQALPLLPGARPGDLTVTVIDAPRAASAVSTEQGSATVEILHAGGLLYDPPRRLSAGAISPAADSVFNAKLEGVDISDNGRFVVFATTTEMTGVEAPDDFFQVYLHDAVKGETILLSESVEGLPGNGDSLGPTISGDGRHIVFETVATNILVDDENGPIRDIVLLDRLDGTREPVNVNSFGELAQIRYLNLNEPVYIDSHDAEISKDGTAVAFRSRAQNLEVRHPNEWWDDKLYVRDLESGTTEIVSTGNDWFHTRGIAGEGSLSRDGRTVAFRFNGPLTREFTGLVDQVYVRDRAEASTTVASRMPDGTLNLESGQMSSVRLSGDGRMVFFRTLKHGFAEETNNRTPSLYRHDRDTQTTVQVDTGPSGQPPDGGISNAFGILAVSEDGERVAFVSSARNFYPGTEGNTPNVFLKNLETGALAPLSTRADGRLTPGSAQWLAMDPTGTAVVFFSNKTGLVDDGETGWHLYGTAIGGLTDRAVLSFAADALTVTRTPSGEQSVEVEVRRFVNLTGTVEATLSTVDGTAVAGLDYEQATASLVFAPGETAKTFTVNLLEPPDSNATKAFAVTLEAGSGNPWVIAPDSIKVTVQGPLDLLSPLVISARDGVMADRESRPVSLSRDGSRVAFGSFATNLAPLDDSSRDKVFVRDMRKARLTLHAKEDAGSPGDGASSRPVLSPDGDWMAYHSQARNLVAPAIEDSRVHLFLENLSTGEIFLVSRHAQGDPGDASTTGWDESTTFSTAFIEVRVPGIGVSEHADWVVFHSRATNLVDEPTENVRDIYLWERATGALSRITSGSGGHSRQPVITPDGRYIAFVSDKTDLVPGEINANDFADVFRYDRLTGEMIRVHRGMNGAEPDGRAWSVAMSGDGDTIAFESAASNLVPHDTNGTVDVFVHTVSTGATERVSVNSHGGQAISWEWSATLPDAGHSLQPSLSEDGRFVVFHSNALGLHPGVEMPEFTFMGETVARPTHKLYVHDRQTAETRSVIPLTPEANGFEARISGDGQYIAFLSTDEAMLDPGTGTRRMVYRFPNPLAQGGDPAGFTAWRTDQFGGEAGNDAIAGPGADPNGDGIPNLLRYLWRQDPLASGPRKYAMEVVEQDGRKFVSLSLWVDPGRGDVNWGMAVSENLEEWTLLSANDYTETVGQRSEGLEERVLRPDTSIGKEHPRFYRLVIFLNE